MCLSRLVSGAYMALLARPSGQRINDVILHLALRARGYNNFQDARLSGEAHFLERVAACSPGVCLDVGANRGAYSAALLELTQARVIAFDLLPGAFETLARLRPRFVQIEYNWHQLFRGCSLMKLAELLPGYVAYQLLPHRAGMVRRDVERPESNITFYSNFVFVRSDQPLG